MKNSSVSYSEVITKSIKALFYPKVMMVLGSSLLISAIVVSVGAFLSWSSVYAFLTGFFTSVGDGSHRWVPQLMQPYVLDMSTTLGVVLAIVVMAILFIPAFIILSTMICSFVSSTYMIRYLAKKDFPELKLNDQSSILVSIKNFIIYTLIYVFLNILFLPLSLFLPGVSLVLSVLLIAWYNQKLASYDILSLWVDDKTRKQIVKSDKFKAYLVSCIAALSIFIPMALLVSPIITYVFLTYYYLTQLKNHQKAA